MGSSCLAEKIKLWYFGGMKWLKKLVGYKTSYIGTNCPKKSMINSSGIKRNVLADTTKGAEELEKERQARVEAVIQRVADDVESQMPNADRVVEEEDDDDDDFQYYNQHKKELIGTVPEKLNQVIGDFVIFDLETTGLYTDTARIIEIAAIKNVGGKLSSFSSLVALKPGVVLKPDVVKLTGITKDDLVGQPPIEEVLRKFRAFIGNLPLVGHNVVQYDIEVINYEMKRHGFDILENQLIDTWQDAMNVIGWGELDNFKLETVAKYYGHKHDGFHRAKADVLATSTILAGMVIQDGLQPELRMSYKMDIDYQDSKFGGTTVRVSSMKPKDLKPIPGIDGKRFTVTSFQHFGDWYSLEDLFQFILDSGGAINSSVTLKTDYLIDCDDSWESSKERKAQELTKSGRKEVKIITPDEFLILAGKK